MTALYAYAVVLASLDPTTAPSGVDDGQVVPVGAGDVAALVTPIDEADYTPDLVERQSKDLAWLGARAAAHDRVLTWAADQGTVIPLPIFSLFRDEEAVRQMLTARGSELSRTLHDIGDAREYTVRVYRLDAQLKLALAARSADVAELESRAANATPGQRYLLERKLEQTRREELDRVGRDTADEVFRALQGIARATARDPVASQAAAAGHAVLNASFLVAAPHVEAFRSAVTRLIERRGPEGFRFEFTGPWAPYHFVRPPGNGPSEVSNTSNTPSREPAA